MIKLVSWDVDGTLFSYRSLAATLIGLAPGKWRQTGFGQLYRELLETWRFHRVVEAQRRTRDSRVVQEDLLPHAQTFARERHALKIALGRMRPPENILDALKRFESMGLVQVALSDFECEYKLRALRIERYFTKAYSCRALGFWKPSTVPLDHLQSIYDVKPHEHLHIGDREDADGEACFRNGCQSAKPTVPFSSLLAIINT